MRLLFLNRVCSFVLILCLGIKPFAFSQSNFKLAPPSSLLSENAAHPGSVAQSLTGSSTGSARFADKSYVVVDPAADPSLSHSLVDGKEIRSLKTPNEVCDYTILSELGQGAMGRVYKARDKKVGREVALKILFFENASDRALKRFQREARIAASLKHPHVVRVYDYGRGDGFVYYTMELHQENLERRLKAKGVFPEKEAIECLLQSLEGLAYLHMLGVKHRDLKPSNLLVKENGQIVIADFSLARSETDVTLTRSKSQIGTPLFMSPEQVQGKTGEITPRSDLYSMGVILYRLLTGEYPFNGANFEEIQQAILKKDPREILNQKTSISEPVKRILCKALAKNPDERYFSAQEFAEDLQKYLGGKGISREKKLSYWSRWQSRKKGAPEMAALSREAQKILDEGEALLAQKNYSDAANAFQNVVVKAPTFYMAHFKLGLALKEFGPSKEAQAMQAFTFAADLNPNSYLSRLERGKIHLQGGRVDLALSDFLRALQIRPQDEEIHELAAQCYERLQENEKAQQHRAKAQSIEEVYVEPPRSSLELSLDGDEAAAEPELSHAIPKQIGKYEVRQLLGRGGMGVVYEAWDPDLNRRVAIKVHPRFADPKAQQRFQKEIEALTRLKHPQVVQVYDAGDEEGRLYYVMEYVEGHSLASEVADRKMESSEAVRITSDLALVMEKVHQAGVIHADIKPANIIRDKKRGQYVLTDFGLARFSDEVTLGEKDQLQGTPAYMSPEQASGEEVTKLSDIYSLGATLYELLAGQRPFQGGTLYSVLEKVKRGEFPRLREINPAIPADLEAIVMRAMALDPSQRYHTMQELHEDLQRFERGQPVLAKQLGWRERATRWARKKFLPQTLSERAANRFAATPFYEAGDLYFTQGNLERAQAEFLRAIDLDPEFSEVYLKLGPISVSLGHCKEALEYLTTFIKLRPDQPIALLERAKIYFEEGEIGKAIEDLDQFRSIQVTTLDYYFYRGLCELRDPLNGLEEAAARFKEVQKRNPRHPAALLLPGLQDEARDIQANISSFPLRLQRAILRELQFRVVGLCALLIKSGNLEICLKIIERLKVISSPQAINAIAELRHDPNLTVRWRVIEVLKKLNDPRVIESLIGLLDYETKATRCTAGKNLLEIGNLDVETWIKLLSNSDSDVRAVAAETLGKIGDPRVVEPLIRLACDNGDFHVRLAAIEVLGKIGDPRAVEPLIRLACDNGDFHVRRVAIEALVRMGDPRAVEPLVGLLDSECCLVASKGLLKFGNHLDIETWIKLLGFINSDVHLAAVHALVKIGDRRVVEPLVGVACGGGDPDVRRAVIEALGRIGDPLAVEPLIGLLSDFLLGRAAIEALGKIGDPRAVEPLIERLIDRDPDCRRAAIEALGRIGDPRAVEPLIRLACDRHGNFHVRATIEALGRIGDPRAVEPLIGLLGNRDPDVLLAAIEALEKIGDPRAVDPLNRLLSDRNNDVRLAAVKAVGEAGDLDAVEPLIWLLRDGDRNVCSAALKALEKIRNRHPVEPPHASAGEKTAEPKKETLVKVPVSEVTSQTKQVARESSVVPDTSPISKEANLESPAPLTTSLAASTPVREVPKQEEAAKKEAASPRRAPIEEAFRGDGSREVAMKKEPPTEKPRRKILEGDEGCAVGRDCFSVESHRRVNELIGREIMEGRGLRLSLGAVSVTRQEEEEFLNFFRQVRAYLFDCGLAVSVVQMQEAAIYLVGRPRSGSAENTPTLLWADNEQRFQLAHAGGGGAWAVKQGLVMPQVYLPYGLIWRLKQDPQNGVRLAAILIAHEMKHAVERASSRRLKVQSQTTEDLSEVEALLQNLRPYYEADLGQGRTVESSTKTTPPIPLPSPLPTAVSL